MLEDIVTNLANHLATGQIPKPYRRGSWRPIGHMRPSSPLLDSVRDLFEDYDQLSQDFADSFIDNREDICDIVFNCLGTNAFKRKRKRRRKKVVRVSTNNNEGEGNKDGKIIEEKEEMEEVEEEWEEREEFVGPDGIRRIWAVRAILAIRSRVFLEMLYGFSPTGSAAAAINAAVAQNAENIAAADAEAKLVAKGERKQSKSPDYKSKKRGSITEQTMHKITQLVSGGERKRKESMKITPTYLTVPGSNPAGSAAGMQQQTGLRGAISRFMTGSWSGWGSKNRSENMKRWQSQSIYANTLIDGEQIDPNDFVPGVSMCADIEKIDMNKLSQTEFTIIEFDGDTMQLLIDYLHTGVVELTCDMIPGLICAAEHFDLPDLLQACFHHTKTHMKLSVAPSMLNQLENYYWRYNSASQVRKTKMRANLN